MLFAVNGIYRGNWTEDADREGIQRFAAWSPAAGSEMKALYLRADGRGIVSLFEAASALAIYESLLPFTPYLDYEVLPIVDVSEGLPVLRRARGLD
jgi:hypothetical protein